MLRFPAKALRAKVIAAYMRRAGYDAAVCFTCGNAGRALMAEGIRTLVIGPDVAHPLRPGMWWHQAEIRRWWPSFFDATSGHLPITVLLEVAEAFKGVLGPVPPLDRRVPTGSGETVVALALAYPEVRWTAVYDNSKPETEYHSAAPLAPIVRALCDVEGL